MAGFSINCPQRRNCAAPQNVKFKRLLIIYREKRAYSVRWRTYTHDLLNARANDLAYSTQAAGDAVRRPEFHSSSRNPKTDLLMSSIHGSLLTVHHMVIVIP
ncbi:MAG: hypothetical protein ACYDHY_14130 [Acidiferrobacterales bacterium]